MAIPTRRFEINLEILVAYMALRNTVHPPRVILEILALIESMNHQHIVDALITAPHLAPFVTKLRVNYSWLTAREGVLLFGIAQIQNNYPKIKNDYAEENAVNDPYLRKVLGQVGRGGSVGDSQKDQLLGQDVKEAEAGQQELGEGDCLQGKQVSFILRRFWGDSASQIV